MRRRTRFHRGGDGWGRGNFKIPAGAVVGSSDCGSWPDSPAPTDAVLDELRTFRAVLRKAKIPSRWGRVTRSGNAFIAKRWVVVPGAFWKRAVELAKEWLPGTRYSRDADWDTAAPDGGGLPPPPKPPPAARSPARPRPRLRRGYGRERGQGRLFPENAAEAA